MSRPREPCPCGSGRRYKACHGGSHAPDLLVARPFDGLGSECDWIALREIVPAATAPVTLLEPRGGRPVTVATVLPLAWPALVRGSGEVLLGLQSTMSTADPSRDLAGALLAALDTPPGGSVTTWPPAGEHRLQDLIVPSPLDVTVYEGFGFWLDPDDASLAGQDAAVLAASRERADAAVVPTARLASVEAAYWCRRAGKAHLRWVLPEHEDTLLDGLARLAADGGLDLADGMRYVGSFRAHGRLVPVWDLWPEASAPDCEEPAERLRGRLDGALGEAGPLSPAERRAREGLRGRQLTLR